MGSDFQQFYWLRDYIASANQIVPFACDPQMEASTANVRITLPPWLTWGYTAVTNYTEDSDTDLVDQGGETPNYFDIKVQHGTSTALFTEPLGNCLIISHKHANGAGSIYHYNNGDEMTIFQ